MRQEILQQITVELDEALTGRSLRRVFQLSPFSLVLDFGNREAGYLFISAEPSQPRMYLIKRTARELEKQSQPPSNFVQGLKSMIGGGRLLNVSKDDRDRVIRLGFEVIDEIGEQTVATLICQLTGRSANLYVLDGGGEIRHALRFPKGQGQQLGQTYQPPTQQISKVGESDPPYSAFDHESFATLSQALDEYYTNLGTSQSFAARGQTFLDEVKQQIAQRKKLKRNLERDLARHGDPEQHKRYGDLLLANISTARRNGKTVTLQDYYSDGAPNISFEVDEDVSLKDEAARYFVRYAKAKRAAEEISARLTTITQEVLQLQAKQAELEKVIKSRDEAGLEKYEADNVKHPQQRSRVRPFEKIPGVRRYLSSDDYEVLVGRAASTNDRLTFKIAKPHDLWLHAADYPGSHVVVRNPSRKDIPHRTIVEAAQLAAKFSQAGDDSKVSVHYTTRKFLAKPKGAAPGLVRMSTFKTITVAPAESIPRL